MSFNFRTAAEQSGDQSPHPPRLEKNIGYAMLPVEYSDLGTNLEVVHPEGPRTVVTVRKSFIDPGKEIPKR